MAKQVDPLARLRAHVGRYETQRQAAAALEISAPYLTQLLGGRRKFSRKVLARLGLRRAVASAVVVADRGRV